MERICKQRDRKEVYMSELLRFQKENQEDPAKKPKAKQP